MSMTAAGATASATAPLQRALQVHERGRLLRGAEVGSLSSREWARALADHALAGGSPRLRSLVIELDGARGHCVLAVGTIPAAVWRFDAGALHGMAAELATDVPRVDARAPARRGEPPRRQPAFARRARIDRRRRDRSRPSRRGLAPRRRDAARGDRRERVIEAVWRPSGPSGHHARARANVATVSRVSEPQLDRPRPGPRRAPDAGGGGGTLAPFLPDPRRGSEPPPPAPRLPNPASARRAARSRPASSSPASR
jgi:hypothetical protein